MKILIVSDTHRKHKNLEMLLDRLRPIDLMIHLGDAEGYEDYIAELACCPLEIVAGNNDFFSNLEQEKIIQVGKYQVMITHGHHYYVGSGIADIKSVARSRGADIVMLGHTHVPLLDYDDDIITLNPGSISYPRQEGKQPSYILMELDKKGEAHFSIDFLKKV